MSDIASAVDSSRHERWAKSYAYCHHLTRIRARNFYYGLKLTPEPKRSALYAIYAWMRAADDLGDAGSDLNVRKDRLKAFWRLTTAALDSYPKGGDDDLMHMMQESPLSQDVLHATMWPAVQKTAFDYQIPTADLGAILEGQLLDQEKSNYDSYDQLREYCYKVAGAVGLVCVRIWGCEEDESIRKLAVSRGIAFQLTNILRDLAEDIHRSRIYLPSDELQQFSYGPADLRQGKVNEAFDKLMAFQIDRARRFYVESANLEESLAPSCRPASWTLMRVYRNLLEKIARNPRRVLSHRVRLSGLAKASIAMQATWRRGVGSILALS